MTVRYYRKKPVVIPAIQFTADSIEEIKEFCLPRKFEVKTGTGENGKLEELIGIVETLEGNHEAQEGDYILKGVRGECYPCKEDIFIETYDKAEGYTP